LLFSGGLALLRAFCQWKIEHPWASAGGGQNGHLPPLEIGTKKQKFMENVKSGI